jgi:hypothetical protein
MNVILPHLRQLTKSKLQDYWFLGWDEIECVVLDCDELRTELAEIDENLIRNDLDSISIGELALRRDEILDALGLRAKSGTNIKNHRTGAGTAPVPKTTADIAKASGISERTLQENKQIAKNLVPEAKEAVREKAIPKSAALELSRLNGNTIQCTPNHPFFTANGWCQASQLEKGTNVYRREDVRMLRKHISTLTGE